MLPVALVAHSWQPLCMWLSFTVCPWQAGRQAVSLREPKGIREKSAEKLDRKHAQLHTRMRHPHACCLSLSLALSLVGPCCPAKRMLCMCFAPFLHDKGRRCCSEREAKSGKGRGREQIQFIFNIIFIVAAARDAEPKNRTEPNRRVPGGEPIEVNLECNARCD